MTTAKTATDDCRAASRPYDAARRAAAVLLLLLLPAVALDAAAAPDWKRSPNQLEPQTLVKPSGISLEQATNMVRRETGGRVLSASPVGTRGYEVRVLIDGKRVKNVFVDRDGRIRSGD